MALGLAMVSWEGEGSSRSGAPANVRHSGQTGESVQEWNPGVAGSRSSNIPSGRNKPSWERVRLSMTIAKSQIWLSGPPRVGSHVHP